MAQDDPLIFNVGCEYLMSIKEFIRSTSVEPSLVHLEKKIHRRRHELSLEESNP